MNCVASLNIARTGVKGTAGRLSLPSLWRLNIKLFSSTSSVKKEKLTKSYVHNPSSEKFLGLTIGQSLENMAKTYPTHEAVVFCADGIRKPYEELLQDVRQAAAGFLSVGVGRGDRIGIWASNTYEWILTQLGAAQIGAILVSLNPGYRSAELLYSLNKVGIKAIVAAPSFKTSDYYAILKENCPELEQCQPGQLRSKMAPSLKTVIMLGEDTFKGTYKFGEVYNNGRDEHFNEVKKIHNDLDVDDPASVLFTSGTTGFPKGCTLSHHILLNNPHIFGKVLGYHEENCRSCLPIPLYHAFASSGGTMLAMTYPVTAVFPSASYEPEATLAAIDKERITALYGTPTIFVDIINHPRFDKYSKSSMRSALMGGSPCPENLVKLVMEQLNIKNLHVGYGLTETGPGITMTPRNRPIDEPLDFVGETLPHEEVKIVDVDSRKIVPINTEGEILCRGYNVMLGYWEDEETTKESIDKAGWFSSGDLGTFDEDGKLRVTGRIKDMIIRGGVNIFPAEIENYIMGHDKIEDVQVVGIPDERFGEQLCACIKLKEGKTSSEEEIKEFCRDKISHYKVPHYVIFVDSFPMTVSFKVKKFELREIAASKLAK